MTPNRRVIVLVMKKLTLHGNRPIVVTLPCGEPTFHSGERVRPLYHYWVRREMLPEVQTDGRTNKDGKLLLCGPETSEHRISQHVLERRLDLALQAFRVAVGAVLPVSMAPEPEPSASVVEGQVAVIRLPRGDGLAQIALYLADGLPGLASPLIDRSLG